MKSICLCSGGIDSTVMLYHVMNTYDEKPMVLAFNYGSYQNDIEFEHLYRTCSKLGLEINRIDVRDLFKNVKSALLGGDIPDGLGGINSTVVPFRNGIFLSIAASIAETNGLNRIFIGNHHEEHKSPPDCTQLFSDSMAEAVLYGTTNDVVLDCPFCYTSKYNIVSIGKVLGVDFRDTYTCYKGGRKHCGKCSTCLDRKEAFVRAGVEDPTEYEV